MRKTRRSATRKTRRSATRKTHRKTHKHKRSKYRRNKRGGADDCAQLYLKCLKKEDPSHGIYTPRPEPPSPPPRKKRSPSKENIYEQYEPDKGTSYVNKSSLGKIKPPPLPKRNKMSPNKYGFDIKYVSEEV